MVIFSRKKHDENSLFFHSKGSVKKPMNRSRGTQKQIHTYTVYGHLSHMTQSCRKVISKFVNLCLDPNRNLC